MILVFHEISCNATILPATYCEISAQQYIIIIFLAKYKMTHMTYLYHCFPDISNKMINVICNYKNNYKNFKGQNVIFFDAVNMFVLSQAPITVAENVGTGNFHIIIIVLIITYNIIILLLISGKQ